MVKNPPAMKETRFDLWVGKSPGEGNDIQLEYSCLENPWYMGYSPWGHKDSDRTEQQLGEVFCLDKAQKS